VFIMNCVTLAIMLMAQSYFWKREVWMIKHLSEDNTVPYSNLPAEVGDYPEFEDAVAGYNKGAFYFALAVGFCIVVNFGMSTDVLINGDGTYNYNLGSRTVTGLLTVRMNEPPRSAASRTLTLVALVVQNTMLVSTKVVGYLSYARLSYANAWCVAPRGVVRGACADADASAQRAGQSPCFRWCRYRTTSSTRCARSASRGSWTRSRSSPPPEALRRGDSLTCMLSSRCKR